MYILKQAAGGIPIPEPLMEHSISSARFYKWRARYGDTEIPMLTRLKELEIQNINAA